MRRFKSNVGVIIGALIMAALFLTFPVMVAIKWRIFTPAKMGLMAPPIYALLAVFAMFGLGFIFACLPALVVIEVDDEGIGRRSVIRRHWLPWRNLTSFWVTGTSQNEYSLWDRDGKRLDIDCSLFAGGGELQAILESRTAALREELLRTWRAAGATLRPRQPFGAVGYGMIALFAAMFLYGAWGVFHLPMHGPGDFAVAVLGSILSAAAGALFLWALIVSATKVVELTHSAVVQRHFFLRREIPYSEIASIVSSDTAVKGTSYASTIVRAKGGTSLTITSHYPHYTSIVEFLNLRAGAPVEAASSEELKASTIKRSRQSVRFLVWMAPVYLALFLGAPLWLTMRDQKRVAEFDRTERLGVTAPATIIGKSTRGSKSVEYLLDYQFRRAGIAAPVHGASPVDYDSWEAASVGQPVTAVYVPGEPDQCHLTISIGRRLGQNALGLDWFYVAAGLAGSALYGYSLVRARKTAAGTWKDPAIPSATVRLAESRLIAIRRELAGIALARTVGMAVGTGSMALFLLLSCGFLIASLVSPAVGALGQLHHQPLWLVLSFAVPLSTALGGMFVFAPIGEVYATLRTRALADELADPRLATDIVRALTRFRSIDAPVKSSASVQLMNALTAILRSGEPSNLSSVQRHFLYAVLTKWQHRPERAPFCTALLAVIPEWGDPAGIEAARTAGRISSVPEVREAAGRAAGLDKPSF